MYRQPTFSVNKLTTFCLGMFTKCRPSTNYKSRSDRVGFQTRGTLHLVSTTQGKTAELEENSREGVNIRKFIRIPTDINSEADRRKEHHSGITSTFHSLAII